MLGIPGGYQCHLAVPGDLLAVPFGAIAQLDFAWLLADTLNGLMAIPNLVSLLLLSPVVVKLTKEYFARS